MIRRKSKPKVESNKLRKTKASDPYQLILKAAKAKDYVVTEAEYRPTIKKWIVKVRKLPLPGELSSPAYTRITATNYQAIIKLINEKLP